MEPQKLDLLNLRQDKSIVKSLEPKEAILLSCAVFKFNDYKKKQERNLMVTTHGVYNLKEKSIRRKIDIVKIKAITISRIGTQFVLHVPDQYDYRYASEKRQKIIYSILKAYCAITKEKMPIYAREELSLINAAMTKEDKKKKEMKQMVGELQMYNDELYRKYLEGEEQEKEMVRKTTKTLYAKDSKETVSLADFIPKLVLGKGAFGTVLLVEKKNTKELFAMKSIKKDDVIRKDQLEHTKTEKMVLEHINHPFLVNLAYAFQTPAKLYFIMHFMKGGELFQHLYNAKKFPQNRAKFYCMQIALALGHLHSEDIIYRDLKLENVLMDDHGNVCLTDFGMTKILPEGQLTETFCGTPQYLAPQVISGGGYGKVADWWSLGILTYEMLYSLPPFYNKQQNLMFQLIQKGQLKFSEKVNLSKQGKDFISKMLVRKPEQRLGYKKDVDEVLAHPWFKDLDIGKMLKKEIPAPFKPKVQGDDWLDGFDKQFTSSTPIMEEDKELTSNQKSKYDEMFKDF